MTRMGSRIGRIPRDLFEEIDKISKEMNLSFPAAMRVWQEKKFNQPKWKTL